MRLISHFFGALLAVSFLSLPNTYANQESLMPHGTCARGAEMLVRPPAANTPTQRPKQWRSGRMASKAIGTKSPTNIVPFKLDSLLDRMPHGVMP